MKVIVQKFGGTSVRSEESRDICAERVVDALREKFKVVVVVSAMGRLNEPYATDTLQSLIGGVMSKASKREQDLLVSCGETISAVVFSELLQRKGLRSIAVTGAQAGFRTTEEYGNARIVEMRVDHIRELLNEMDVVVVAGFQGETPIGTLATLGRGGSDTSATALGAALNAEVVDIYTDVSGIMTADPRLVEDAQSIKNLTYSEVSNLAYQGAKVIHPRAVEIAMQAKVPIRIRGIDGKNEGTLIASSRSALLGRDIEERPVTGIAHVNNLTQVNVSFEESNLSLQAEVFSRMANENISVDFIQIQPTSLSFSVPSHLKEKVVERLNDPEFKVSLISDCAKVSAVGAGMSGVPGIVAKITASLEEAQVEILQAADSHTTIWILINEKHLVRAVNALHKTFIDFEQY